MKTIYFVRHGESEENVGAVIVQGGSSPLTTLGHEQARFIAERAANLDFEIIVASPMRRAQDTAGYIAEKTGKPIITEALLSERKVPPETLGKVWDDPAVDELFVQWEKSMFDENLRAGGGENFTDLSARAGRAMEYLASRPESSLLVVSHGFLLRTIIARIIFGDTLTAEEYKKVIQAFRTKNTGLTWVEYEPTSPGTRGLPAPKWLIRVWNDHAHLG